MNKNVQRHTLKTKPTEVIRLESHTKEEVKTWFENLGMLRVQISAKAEAERIEELKRATRLLSQAIGKHKESLRVAGVAARKINKTRKRSIQEMAKTGEVILPNSELLIQEREPDKEPNASN